MGRMEAAVVSGILNFLGKKFAQLINSEYSSLVGAKKDLEQLHDLIEHVNNWLETAGDEVTGSWLRQLKDVAYAADGLVDEFQLKAQKHEASGVVSKYICTIPESFIVQSKVKTIKNKFAAIVKQSANFTATENSLPADHPVRHINRIIVETTSVLDEALVFGRADEKAYIISKLLETNDQHNRMIVSIVGLGGSGKTTLAKLIFHDGIIQEYFEIRLWVYVSQEFELIKLVKKLFEAIAGETSEDHTLEYMSSTISHSLLGKRCLLVLDDVWVEDRRHWEQLMIYTMSSAPRSKILLTTRSREVAQVVESTHIFVLASLSQEASWALFTQCLGMTAERLDAEFVEVGKEIIQKCAGMPLAIKVLANALRGKEWIEQWRAIRDSNFVDAEYVEHDIFTVLMLSYFHMPSYLKQCFAICSVFPKGYRIDKEKLIDLWIAHDMITLENGVEYLEHTGQRCFNSLLQMSFLQKVSDEYGRVSCTMHDLIHDLARTVMGEEISTVVPKVATSTTKSYRYFSITEWPLNLPSVNLFEEARALYVAGADSFNFGRALQNAKHLHSISVECTASIPTTLFRVKNLKYLEISGLKCEALPEAITDIWSLQALRVTDSDILNLPKSIGNLQKLRTLNLSWCKRLKSLPGSISNCHMISTMDLSGCIEFQVLPDFIGTNKRLRVLRISHTKVKRLPSSITSLENLEFLELQQCPELVELPEGLENLKKLKVLNVEGCPKLRGMLVGTRQLRLQQNLNILIVGQIQKWAKLSELRNTKGIAYVMNLDDAKKACLKKKTDLQRLHLQWGRNGTHKEADMEAALDGLEPPSRIKGLYVSGYEGGQYAHWMLKQASGGVQAGVSQFPYLTVMSLCGLPNLKQLDSLMGLPCLEELDLRWMPSLKSISGGPFPSLVKLRMEGLRSLEELQITEGPLADGEEGKIEIGKCLSELHIEECPKLMVKPFYPSSLGHLVLKRSNGQLLLLPGQGQGPSSSSISPPFHNYSQLKELELWSMIASSSPPPSPAPPGSGSGHGWQLLQHMTALESLKIYQCSGLTELPESIQSLKSLRSLFINFCSAICMLPEWLGELSSLEKMAIQSCHSLSGLPQSIDHLTSLQELRIERCDELHQLPEFLGKLCSLRKLGIASLQGLTCLPKSMCWLTSLEELEISDCQGLVSSLEWIRGLHALQKLKITGCPDLERRCEREKGEDWHLVDHIPHLQIGLDEEGQGPAS